MARSRLMTSTTPEKTIEALRSVLPTMCCQYSWYQTTGPNSLQVSFWSCGKETALSICWAPHTILPQMAGLRDLFKHWNIPWKLEKERVRAYTTGWPNSCLSIVQLLMPLRMPFSSNKDSAETKACVLLLHVAVVGHHLILYTEFNCVIIYWL